MTANYIVGLALAQARGTKYPDEVAREYHELEAMPELIERVISQMDPVADLARQYAQSSSILFLGRHVGYPVALEGALKLKELAYMHAEGFAAGELKHGPIALIEEGLPVIVVMPSPRVWACCTPSCSAISARSGPWGAHDRHRRRGR